jgi:integrase
VSSGLSKSTRGKSHADYWLKKVYRPKYGTEHGARETGTYSVKIQYLGRRELFPLNTSNRPEAAKTAKHVWASLVANGWDRTLVQFKPSAVYIPPIFVTVGEYLDYLEENHLYTQQALYRNTTKFFTALGSMFETDKPRSRFDARRDGLKKWREKLRAVKLADLTPMKVELWKANYLALRSENPMRELRAKHTLDAYIRASKAMFGPRIRKRLSTFGITLPAPIPFADISFVTRGRSSYRYRSRFDPIALTKLALDELPIEQLKVFLLALHLGLRRNEIDKLTWSQFDYERLTLRVEVTVYAQLKTEGSEADVGLEKELADYFQRLSKAASGIFVINSIGLPRKTSGWQHYRANAHFDSLCGWLRAHGVETQKPIHTLRKEFGKLIAEKMGLFASSLALRHSSVSVTEIFYAGDDRPKVTGLGKLLKHA